MPMASMCCHCPANRTQKDRKDSKSNPRQEIWRLRLNWLFLIIIGSLYAISYTAISSSFHQFMTNPRANNHNDTAFERIEPGLGQTEAFYSWVITLFNVGALIGGFGTGCLVKFIPYWYLILVSLVLHIIGYILYAISDEGWLIMTSKLLSGYFIGAELTLALSYFAESSIDYQAAMKKLGKPVESSEAVRNNLFALHNIGVNIGYFLGPGAAAVFAQFQIDQFRSIAWYNVAFGIVFILLQIILFHGESTCKTAKRCHLCQSKLRNPNIGVLEIAILSFLILCRGVLSFRFGAYETIYNPVLSDYFGFNERDSSYFFFGLVIAQTSGTVLLLVFQHLRWNSRIIAIIGLVMTVLSCILMADWQSIPYDPCTELSPFHHPDIISNYRDVEVPNTNFVKTEPHNSTAKCANSHRNKADFIIYASIKVNAYQMPINNSGLACIEVDTCTENCNDGFDQCLHYTLDLNWCIQECNNVTIEYHTHHHARQFLCKQPLYSLCIIIYQKNFTNEFVNESLHTVHLQALQMLEVDLYAIAVNRCESADIHGHQCYWIPNSIITDRHCSDCPPICRSIQSSLTFVQFCIGAALLMVSIPIAWVPVAALISDRVHREAQGLVMGVIVALTAIGRSISPLWLDAAYEGLMKRTFVAMLVLLATHLPFLIGIIFMYGRLGFKPTESAFKDFKESDDSESDLDINNENESDNFLFSDNDTRLSQ